MSHSFVVMVTYHIPQIAPSSGRWVVLSLSFYEAGAHTEWRRLETRWQPDTDGDVLVEPEWLKSPSVTFLRALLKWGFPNNTIPKRLPSLSFSQHIFIIKVSNAVCDTGREHPYLKAPRKASIKKRKCYLLLCHILSFVLIYPVDPVTFSFSFKAAGGLTLSAARPFVLIKFTRGFIQIEYSPPLLISLFWQELTSVKELNSADSVSSRSQCAEGKLSQKHFMTLFESYCQPQEKEATCT